MYIFVEANCFILRNRWFISACCFRCLERIRSSIHLKLFAKLIQRKVPMYFVRLLKHGYKEQTMQTKRASICLDHFMLLMRFDKGGIESILVC